MVPVRCPSPKDPRFGLVYIPQQVDQEKFDIYFHEESVKKKEENIIIRKTGYIPHYVINK